VPSRRPYRSRRDQGRLIETWYYHEKTGQRWEEEKAPPRYVNGKQLDQEEVLAIDIRFHQKEGYFFADLHDDSTIQEESLKTLRRKLRLHIEDSTKAHDDDWEQKILVVADWDEDNLIGASFTHVGVKGDNYRCFDERGKLMRNMESTRGAHFMDYDAKRFKELEALTKLGERFRTVMPALIFFGKSKLVEANFKKLVAEMDKEFKALKPRQRKTEFGA
jgi:hypothetical protein